MNFVFNQHQIFNSPATKGHLENKTLVQYLFCFPSTVWIEAGPRSSVRNNAPEFCEGGFDTVE